MFERVYLNPASKVEDEKARQLLTLLYQYYSERLTEMPEEYQRMLAEGKGSREQIVCDYIAGMSDSYAIAKFEELFVPRTWKG